MFTWWTRSRTRVDVTWILVFSLLAHGLLLVSGDHYWDGLHYHPMIVEHDSSIIEPFRDAGYPLQGLFLYAVGFLPASDFMLRLITFGCVFGTGTLVYDLAGTLGRLPRPERLLIACLSVTYPVYVMGIIDNNTPTLLSLLCFFVGARCALRADRAGGRIHIAWRMAALVAFVLSFVHRSHLVFYFGFLLLWWLWMPGRFIERTVAFLRRRLDFCLLPVAYWFFNEQLFPPRGLYISNDSFVASKLEMLRMTGRSMWLATADVTTDAFASLCHAPWIPVVVIPLALVATRRRASDVTDAVEAPIRPCLLIGVGLLLLFLAVFPYAAVNKVPQALNGWTARWLLLAPLPVALLAVGACSIGRRRWLLARRAVLGALLGAFVCSSIGTHLYWLARAAKDRSIMAQLARMPRAEGYSIYWVDDHVRLGAVEPYRYYEWTAMFHELWGGERRIGMTQPEAQYIAAGSPMLTHIYRLGDFDPNGCQADLTILPDRNLPSSDWVVGWRYVKARLLTPGRLPSMLKAVTKVTVRPRAECATPLVAEPQR